MSDEDVYWGTRLACVEMIRTGTTSLLGHVLARPRGGARGRGRGAAGGHRGAADRRLRSRPSRERACADADAQPRADRRGAAASGRGPGFAPHAIYSLSASEVAALGRRAGGRARGTGADPPLGDRATRSSSASTSTGCGRPRTSTRCGLLGPGTVLAHGVWLDDAELELIAERGATVVTNPVANLKLAVGGLFPYLSARERGVAMGSAPTAPAPTTRSTCLPTRRSSRCCRRTRPAIPAAVTAAETLELATGRRSPLLGGTPLEVGASRRTSCWCAPTRPSSRSGDLDAGLVYAASGSVVDTTVVAGQRR